MLCCRGNNEGFCLQIRVLFAVCPESNHQKNNALSSTSRLLGVSATTMPKRRRYFEHLTSKDARNEPKLLVVKKTIADLDEG